MTRVSQRIGTAFHEGFTVSRPSLALTLELAVERKGNLSFDVLREHTNLGPNYVKAMPRYGLGCGLLAAEGYSPTALGLAVHAHDAALLQQATLWLMHYHMSAPQGPGPTYWHWVVTDQLRIGATLEVADLGDRVRSFLAANEGRTLGARTVKTAASVLLGTYAKDDGLGKLGLLEEAEETGRFRVLEPDPVPTYAVGFALAHYWETVWGEAGTVNLADLFEPGGFADLLYLSEFALKDALRSLRRDGHLSLNQVAPPHQVVRLWNSSTDFLGRLYD